MGPPICASGWLYGVHCISHGSYCQTLYLGRGGPQDQDARVRHEHWMCRYRSLNRQLPQLDDFSCNGIFANVTYTPSARVVCVRIGLVALPFPSRAPGDKIRGRYSECRAVSKSHLQARKGGPNLCSERETPHPVVRIVRYTCVHMYG